MNNQHSIEPWYASDGTLQVFKIWKTIQGEGPFVGTPAVFVRLAGCNLSCSFCDTDHTSHYDYFGVDDIVGKVEFLQPLYGLVVLTGGEPLRQNIAPLIHRLFSVGYEVQVETNGTLYLSEVPWSHVTVVCSPKTALVSALLLCHVNAWKYVVKAGELSEVDGLPKGMMRPSVGDSVYLQPMDEGCVEKNQRNRDATIASCLKYGHRLCLQIHKMVGLE